MKILTDVWAKFLSIVIFVICNVFLVKMLKITPARSL